jgi:hypothetical protein
MDEMDDIAMIDIDLDPSLSLNAEGLWSDEESLQNPQSDSEDPDISISNSVITPKRRVSPPNPPKS